MTVTESLCAAPRGRAFVVHPYLPAGGTMMAYYLARILHLDFGMETIAVGDESPADSNFDFDVIFSSVGIERMRETITDDDILIANPSFSDHLFGLNCRGRKVMYVQGFNTFSLLDCRFHLYVSVSEFVRRFLAGVYGIETEVIPPFIRADRLPRAPLWADRPERSVLVSTKGNSSAFLDRLRWLLPEANLGAVLGRMPQRELLELMGRHRIYLTLSPAEGFGLMALEAMAMGAAVVGFDGFGSLAYMRRGLNCAVAPYADIEGVAERLAIFLKRPERAEALARAGQATALDPLYSYERFRTDWRRIFARFLQREARLEALPTVHLAPDGGVGDLEAFGAQRRRKVGAA